MNSESKTDISELVLQFKIYFVSENYLSPRYENIDVMAHHNIIKIHSHKMASAYK